MENEQLDPKKSLDIIQNAISQTRFEKTDAYFYLINWGIILFIYFFLHYLGGKFEFFKMLLGFSTLLFLIGAMISIWHSKRMNKKEIVKPVNDSLFMYTWGGIGLCIGLWMINYKIFDQSLYLGLLMLLFGLASFITGGVTKFRLSVICGVLTMIISAVIPLLNFSNQFLATCIGIMLSCIIPGFAMFYKIKKKKYV
ncbi:hypothetical protein SAMN05421692_3123 [Chryseobacterium indologenes]|uniref:hypothetical protein n=1 Tax=Chryseobacterium indologenes TaxID=253 RepID=UPI0003E07165|nr:hypothetical protein [Chryseobacterium indologenes]GAE66772.1 hypothetical protein CIN01S_18_00990 [Chryseobacterium indologenes NBRC 14944]SFK01212.1 hypothetical protein SAMN05421692_3123 [Chryseobacterium indologenes]SUX49577.1 Uncharacterised protein [Chryseobacterium indologenes]